MAVEKIGEKYRCNICGNEVVVTAVGGGTLVCCGEDMEKLSNRTVSQETLPPDG
ncbi:MAG: desulfoferrodoxin FeS4 iron-binding domain-containing protein [Chloroflexi bacterium]|nr:desulfoferrodoxin FeS4 iron-binding domain-containing protein [Chloroflexota bacterium]